MLGRVRRLIQFRQMSSMAMLNQQLVQVGRLLAGIVHEIRGPLAVICGSAELLLCTESPDTENLQWIDAILRNGPIDDNRLVVWKLAPSRRVLVASPDYLRRVGAPKSLEDLDGHRGVFYTNRGADDWRFIDAKGNAVVIRGQVAFRANNGTMVLDAAIALVMTSIAVSLLLGH